MRLLPICREKSKSVFSLKSGKLEVWVEILGRKWCLGLLPVHVVGAVWCVGVRVLWSVEFVELSSEFLCSRPLSFCDSKRSMSPQLIGQRPTYVQRISPYHTRLSGHSLHFTKNPITRLQAFFGGKCWAKFWGRFPHENRQFLPFYGQKRQKTNNRKSICIFSSLSMERSREPFPCTTRII